MLDINFNFTFIIITNINGKLKLVIYTAWKVSKCCDFSSQNTGKYKQEKNPYLDIFNVVFFKY